MNSSQDCVDIPPSMQKELGSLATSNWGNIRVIREKKSGNNKKGREEGGTHIFCQKMLSKIYPDTLETRIKQQEEAGTSSLTE